MKVSEAKEVIKELYKKTNTVTALISERGVGKTSAYQQSAEELGIEYIGLYAAALEGPDFMGLPAKDLDKGITRYLAPQFLPTQSAIEAGHYQAKGLLVLEEINRVPSDTVSVLYPLLLEKKINGHVIGEGWAIGVTMNPDTLNYLVNALDDAMLDRFISVQVEPTIEDYLAYSRDHNGNEKVLAFLEDFPDMLLNTNTASESGVLSKSPTPRGWTSVQEIMNTCELPEHLLTEVIKGIVGPIATSAFLGHIGKLRVAVPSAKGILTDYKGQQAKVLKLVEERQTPILTRVIENVVALLEEAEAMIPNLDQFMGDLPDEMQVYFYKLSSRENDEVFDYFNERSLMFETIGDMLIDRMVI